MTSVPPPRSPYGEPWQRTVTVIGAAGVLEEAVRDAARAGWEVWAVVRHEPDRWTLTVGRQA